MILPAFVVVRLTRRLTAAMDVLCLINSSNRSLILATSQETTVFGALPSLLVE